MIICQLSLHMSKFRTSETVFKNAENLIQTIDLILHKAYIFTVMPTHRP